jgi:hypothetical protein
MDTRLPAFRFLSFFDVQGMIVTKAGATAGEV